MNFNSKIALMLAIFVFGSNISITAKKVNDKQLEILLNDFLDINSNPEMKLPEYADKLNNLLQEDKRFNAFCKDIMQLKADFLKGKQLNPQLIGLKLLKYKTKFPLSIQKRFQQQNINELLASLKRRI